MMWMFIGWSFGFAAAWGYFKFAGLLRTKGEYRLALHYSDADVSRACEIQANKLEGRA